MTQVALPLKRIISGGQTGADQGGLAAAKELGISTGGWMPQGWRTDEGPRPEFEALYSMQETESSNYPPRTEWNVCQSNATFLFSNHLDSPGSRLTYRLCGKYGRPVMLVPWWSQQITPQTEYEWQNATQPFRDWLAISHIEILNVAGNRERTNPGIYNAVKDFLISALKDHISP